MPERLRIGIVQNLDDECKKIGTAPVDTPCQFKIRSPLRARVNHITWRFTNQAVLFANHQFH